MSTVTLATPRATLATAVAQVHSQALKAPMVLMALRAQAMGQAQLALALDRPTTAVGQRLQVLTLPIWQTKPTLVSIAT